MTDHLVAVHGGAATVGRATIGEDRAVRGLDALRESLWVAHRALQDGAAALDAAVAAVRVLEDAEDLNAGRGAALTSAGTVELDAAVCDGTARRAGAVTVVSRMRHPVDAARAVLDDGRHVLLAGPAADAFALACGLEEVDPSWFVTERQQRALERVDGDRGTVGAVVRDGRGHLAAATSTGGMSGQRPGRVGDSPILGAGTWADDATAAISATGAGEAFLRSVFAHRVHMLVLAGAPLAAACDDALAEVRRFGGFGGCIAVGRSGPAVLPFTGAAMFRGWIDGRGAPRVGLDPSDGAT
jgi:isoaspartyl peptidase/L-asparaginase-like protein (Ntn-hydrolase superfamily)